MILGPIASRVAETYHEGSAALAGLGTVQTEASQLEIVANNQLDDADIQGVIFTASDLRFRPELESAFQHLRPALD